MDDLTLPQFLKRWPIVVGSRRHRSRPIRCGIPSGSLARRRGLPAAALSVLLLFGCAPGGDLPPIPDYVTSSYKLGGGDQVRIITFGEDQLTGDFKLDDQGDIALPLIGNVKGAGLTPTELAGRITDELRRRHLLSDPSVAVEVASYRPVFVLGEVNKPGEYPYQPGMTMLTTVAVAGGFTYRAVQGYASVVRTTGDKAVQGRITPLSFVAPGDVINVFERRY